MENRTYKSKTLYLETEKRGFFIIHPDSSIERTDMYFPPTERWQVVGLGLLKGRDGVVSLEQVTPEWVKSADLTKYCVVDFDCGAVRWWNDKILNIYFYDRPEDTNYYKYVRKEPVIQFAS